jgi:hypothetical protein
MDDRIVEEVKAYNREYGVASLADVVTELNTRCGKLRFQGELEHYARKGEKTVRSHVDRLVRQGRIREIKIKGAKTSYVAG